MQTSDNCTIQFRVRYGETDQMGVVYHANYLSWFEMGRTELIRETGFSYQKMEKEGILLPVTDAVVSYKQPARYDDLLEVRTWIEQLTPVRLTFAYQLVRVADGELLANGQTRHVFATTRLKPIRLDRQLPELYERLQAEWQRCARAAAELV